MAGFERVRSLTVRQDTGKHRGAAVGSFRAMGSFGAAASFRAVDFRDVPTGAGRKESARVLPLPLGEGGSEGSTAGRLGRVTE